MSLDGDVLEDGDFTFVTQQLTAGTIGEQRFVLRANWIKGRLQVDFEGGPTVFYDFEDMVEDAFQESIGALVDSDEVEFTRLGEHYE